MISKAQQIEQEAGVKIKNVESMSKSKWKKQVKEKIGKATEERTKQEMIHKTKASTIAEDTRERKKYLQECDSDIIKDVTEIRLQMWQVNCNFKRDNTNTKCPLCKIFRRNLECQKASKFTLSKENSKGEWEELTDIYRKNKKREIAVIKSPRVLEQDN